MTDLSDRLDRLGLSQYLDAFISEGFDTWETLSDITESDLNYLNVKLGHRRKLQRAIAESRGQPPDKALNEGQKQSSVGSDESGAEPRDQGVHSSSHGNPTSSSGPGTKRKYRRHPKRDGNAPERPPSAYVIFSNQIREELKGQDLTFTEIAKVVGERWQVLPPEVREHCELQANSAKERYYAELAEYKKTADFQQYQEYLLDFKAKYGPSRTEGKRSKLETETSSASLPTVIQGDSVERGTGTRSAPNLSASLPRSSGSSPPSAGGFATQSGFRRPSLSSSPALHSEAVNSPVKPDPYSPGGSSPAMSAVYSANEYRQPGRGESRTTNYSGASQYSGGQGPYQSPSYRTGPGDSLQDSKPPNTTYMGVLPRRTSRGSTPPIPSLVHQDSTISSDSVSSAPPPIPLMPMMDQGKPGSRKLPQPVNFGTPGQRASPLDLRSLQSATTGSAGPSLLPTSTAGGHLDPQRASNWPALLRATELAREAAMKGTDVLPDRRGGGSP